MLLSQDLFVVRIRLNIIVHFYFSYMNKVNLHVRFSLKKPGICIFRNASSKDRLIKPNYQLTAETFALRVWWNTPDSCTHHWSQISHFHLAFILFWLSYTFVCTDGWKILSFLSTDNVSCDRCNSIRILRGRKFHLFVELGIACHIFYVWMVSRVTQCSRGNLMRSGAFC